MPTGKPKYNVVLTENVSTTELQRRSWCMPISLPLQITQSFLGNVPEEQKERLTSIFQYIVTQSGCRSFTIVLADTLQRFAVMNAENLSEKDAIAKINELAQPLVNMLRKLIGEYKEYVRANNLPEIEINLIRWDEALQSDKCQRCRVTIEDKQLENKEYFRAIGSTALEFQKGSRIFDMSPGFMMKVYENSLAHVLEECSVYLGWDYDVILHPVKASDAITMTHELFIKPKSSDILHYIIFKLKQNKPLQQTECKSLLALAKDKLTFKQPEQQAPHSVAGDLLISMFQYVQEHPDQLQLGVMFVGEVIKYTTADGGQQKAVEPRIPSANISLAAQLIFFPQAQAQAQVQTDGATKEDDLKNTALISK